MTHPCCESWPSQIDFRELRRTGQVTGDAIGLYFKLPDGGATVALRFIRRTRGQIAGVRLDFECPLCARARELLYANAKGLACRRDLSEEDRAELLRFAAFLQARSAAKESKRG